MFNFLLAVAVWIASPKGGKPHGAVGCEILLTTVKKLGREGREVLSGGLWISSRAMRLLRQTRRADFLAELARAGDVDFQFEPLIKFRRAFEGRLSDQREINHAEIQRLYPHFLPRAPYPGVVLAPEGDPDLRPWLDAHKPGWRRDGTYVVKATETLRLFVASGSERRDFAKGSYVLIDDSLAVDHFAGPERETARTIDLEAAWAGAGKPAPLWFRVSHWRRFWSRLRGSL